MQTEKLSIKKGLKTILKDRIFISLMLGGLFLNIVNFVVARFLINFDQPILILHYNVFLGIDQIGFDIKSNIFQLFSVLVAGLSIWLIDLILSVFLYLTSLKEQLQYVEVIKREKVALEKENQAEKSEIYPKIFGAYLLLSGGLIIALAIGIYTISIVLVNN